MAKAMHKALEAKLTSLNGKQERERPVDLFIM